MASSLYQHRGSCSGPENKGAAEPGLAHLLAWQLQATKLPLSDGEGGKYLAGSLQEAAGKASLPRAVSSDQWTTEMGAELARQC